MALFHIEHLHIHTDSGQESLALLKSIHESLIINNKNQSTIMADLTKLQESVQKDTDAVNSAVTLLQGLSQAIKDAGTDQTKLDALTTSLDASTQTLADAVAANTPAAPQA